MNKNKTSTAVVSSELVRPLRDLINIVNAFMSSCEAEGVKIPFVPCEILMCQMKTQIKIAEKAMNGEAA
jgi:hypothetical protein